MMKKYIPFLLFFMFTSTLYPQVVQKNLNTRKYESFVIKMENFPAFLNKGLNISDFYLYAYDQAESNWRSIPFQIDDKISDNVYNFDIPSDTVDGFDELVFMIKDLGDSIPDGFWIPNSESRNMIRYEIGVEDTLWQDELGIQKAWCYFFHSNTILDFDAEDYIDYDTDLDTILSTFYTVGFDVQNGLPNYYAISSQGGGNGVDLLDRIKFNTLLRNISYRSPIGDLNPDDQYINENIVKRQTILHNPSLDVSRVRVIRNLRARIEIEINYKVLGVTYTYTYEYPEDVYFPIYFYPYYMNIESDKIDLDIDNPDISFNIASIRTSTDLIKTAFGMYFYNPYNRIQETKNLIDGEGRNSGLDYTLDVPSIYWSLITGDQGSMIMTTTVPDIGTVQRLYFWDNRFDDDAHDGAPSTGEPSSWGDNGVWIMGTDITGQFSLRSTNYFLPANQPVEIGDTLKAYAENPLDIQVQIQPFDTISPGIIVDLAALPVSDSAIQLNWTASGDDDNSGRAARYELGYSTIPVTGDKDVWFQTATKVLNLPLPGMAGTKDSVIITDLDRMETYHFAIRVFDEADVNDGQGNYSQLSNIATTTTLDVELISFTAQATYENIIISWKTASEDNNLGFEIQRKSAGKTDEFYETIAFIPGYGTTVEPQAYSYTDTDVLKGQYVYRIKQVNLDGSFLYYGEIQVSLAVPKQFTLYQNYPNPFNATTILVYDLPEDGHVSLIIYNMNGQVMSKVVDGFKNAGQYKEKIKASHWPSGLYFARLTTATKTAVIKLILME